METGTKNTIETNQSIRCTIREATSNKNEKKRQFVVTHDYNMKSKKPPTHLVELQQNFNNRFYSLKENVQKEGANSAEPKNNTPPPQNNSMNSLSQIAPIFNLLSGGKNPEIGNLMSALGSGNMDMNKMLNSMVQSQAVARSNKSEAKPVNTKSASTDSTIKNLKRI